MQKVSSIAILIVLVMMSGWCHGFFDTADPYANFPYLHQTTSNTITQKVGVDTRRMRLTIYQGPVFFGDPQGNVKLIRQVAQQAAAGGTQLLVFPEVTLSGYTNFTFDKIHSMAELRQGTSYEQIRSICMQYNISIAYGYIEKDPSYPSILYDSAQLISNNGIALLNHRKVHLSGGEVQVFHPGDGFGPVTTLNGFRIGLLICYEVSLPEPSRVLALMQAEVIVILAAQPAPPQLNIFSTRQVPTRASENLVFVAYSNFAQLEGMLPFHGMATIADPYGATLAIGDVDKTQMVTADLIPGNYQPPCVLLRDRLPLLYHEVCNPDGYCLHESN